MPCTARSAVLARSLVRTALEAWGLEHLADTGALVVTELVSNSVTHTRTYSIRVTVSRPSETFVRVAVADSSKAVPILRVSADGHDEAGRGLAIIEALTWRWGTDCLPLGKRVWGDLRSEIDSEVDR
ncbi:ATP-binding protein [Streptomyces sp. NBC_01716]|uniref:ATP-binding protein n=1 Tax=Streptomyces sp. NBC_01716 TaxID=2975917 RepID=UPI002E2F25FF|nr:ATP-binding protein [Streptomyces sp. NBC_01716]